jgi:pilus assembly protein Flp/PilA
MVSPRRVLRVLVRDERGQDLIEYALLASLIAVVLITTVGGAGARIGALWTNVASGIPEAWK